MHENTAAHKNNLSFLLSSLYVLGWGPRRICQAIISLTLVCYGPGTNYWCSEAPLAPRGIWMCDPELEASPAEFELHTSSLCWPYNVGWAPARSDLLGRPMRLPPPSQGLSKIEPLYLFETGPRKGGLEMGMRNLGVWGGGNLLSHSPWLSKGWRQDGNSDGACAKVKNS